MSVTTTVDNEVPGLVPGHLGASSSSPDPDTVLARLISVPGSDFGTDYWGRQALLSSAAELPRPFDDLLSLDAVDELLSERGLRTPFLRVAKAGNTLPDKSFTASGGVGAGIEDQVSDDRLTGLFADGSTVVLQALHRVWPPVIELCQNLAAELGHPVQANAYITPPQNQGFSNHYDVHDVFVLQLAGEKRWQIHAPVLPSPLRDQPWSNRRQAVEARAAEPPLIDTVLRPGDCLYLPRGFLHAATALGGVTAHLTIGVHSWTRYALAEQLLQQALRAVASDAGVRGSLAMGVDFADAGSLGGDVEQARSALIAALQNASPDAVAAALRQSARGTQRGAPIGPLRQLRDAGALTETTELQLRRHLSATVEILGGRCLVRSRAADFPVGQDEVDVVRRFLTSRALPAGELGLELARRMLLAGLAVVG